MKYTQELFLGKRLLLIENRLLQNLTIEERKKVNDEYLNYRNKYTQAEIDYMVDNEKKMKHSKNNIEREILDNEINCF